jgi:hypothetical protein
MAGEIRKESSLVFKVGFEELSYYFFFKKRKYFLHKKVFYIFFNLKRF